MTHLLSRLSCAISLLFLLFVALPAAGQNGTFSGTITVQEDGAALPEQTSLPLMTMAPLSAVRPRM